MDKDMIQMMNSFSVEELKEVMRDCPSYTKECEYLIREIEKAPEVNDYTDYNHYSFY